MFKYMKIIVTSQNNKINEAYGYVKSATFVEVLKNSLFESGRKLEGKISCVSFESLKVSVYFANI